MNLKKITRGLIFSLLSIIILSNFSVAQTATLAEGGVQATFGNLQHVSQFGYVVFSDQPDKDTITMLKERDIKLVLSIRGFNEKTGYNERKAVEKQGISFIQIPYMKGREISDDALSEIMEVVIAAGQNGTKMMLHCTHSQRAGSVLGATLYRDYGYSKQDALNLAKQAGLTSETLITIHNNYINSLN